MSLEMFYSCHGRPLRGAGELSCAVAHRPHRNAARDGMVAKEVFRDPCNQAGKAFLLRVRDLAAAAGCTVVAFWRLAGEDDGDVLWIGTGPLENLSGEDARTIVSWFRSPASQRVAWCHALHADELPLPPALSSRRGQTFHRRLATIKQQADKLQERFPSVEFLVYIILHDGPQGVESHTLSSPGGVRPHDLPGWSAVVGSKLSAAPPNPPGALPCCTCISSGYCTHCSGHGHQLSPW